MDFNTSMIIGWLCGQMKIAERDLGIYKEDGIAPAMKRLVRVSNMSLSSMQAEAEKVSSRPSVNMPSANRIINKSRIVAIIARESDPNFTRIGAEKMADKIIKELGL